MSTTLLVNAAVSALLNVVVLAAFPFLCYFAYHRWRHQRGLREIAQRAGLQWGERRYIVYGLLLALVGVGWFIIAPPAVEPFLRPDSPQRVFNRLGFSVMSVTMALLYGVVKTGFSEEFLFRGLLAGSLARRLAPVWANLTQALIFRLPHLLILKTRPELWGVLPLAFAGALVSEWLRVKSGLISAPWLMHAVMNVATCLNVALRT